jgi:L-lactate dehydrogenase complex protein LldF
VHWASNAEEHNAIVLDIIRQQNATSIVKSKSMLTEECHLNPYLLRHGVEIVDTDLGERIVQLRQESPSHLVLPAIHLKKEDVGATFFKHLGTAEGEVDPQVLTEAARQHLRARFLAAEVAISGVNFAVAETGSIVVCTNEGNADLAVNLARVHIASMGIEKLIPRLSDLSVFTRLLARSATGQPATTYTSHFSRPAAGKELHVILVDNGRTQQLGRPDFRASLKCIRCGACMNTCPVYRRSGGHSYDFTVPGPIGAILSPNIDMRQHASLPFASTLCGSCTDVCPVKIDIHTQLYKWRQVIAAANEIPASKKWSMRLLSRVLARPSMYELGGKFARQSLRFVPHALTHAPGYNPWAIARELPAPPPQSFREWFKQTQPKP